jgi:hypothetical protein
MLAVVVLYIFASRQTRDCAPSARVGNGQHLIAEQSSAGFVHVEQKNVSREWPEGE